MGDFMLCLVIHVIEPYVEGIPSSFIVCLDSADLWEDIIVSSNSCSRSHWML